MKRVREISALLTDRFIRHAGQAGLFLSLALTVLTISFAFCQNNLAAAKSLHTFASESISAADADQQEVSSDKYFWLDNQQLFNDPVCPGVPFRRQIRTVSLYCYEPVCIEKNLISSAKLPEKIFIRNFDYTTQQLKASFLTRDGPGIDVLMV